VWPAFAGLINHAKEAASRLVLKYVASASVAIPFFRPRFPERKVPSA
jgi:hypothetical protein